MSPAPTSPTKVMERMSPSSHSRFNEQTVRPRRYRAAGQRHATLLSSMSAVEVAVANCTLIRPTQR